MCFGWQRRWSSLSPTRPHERQNTFDSRHLQPQEHKGLCQEQKESHPHLGSLDTEKDLLISHEPAAQTRAILPTRHAGIGMSYSCDQGRQTRFFKTRIRRRPDEVNEARQTVNVHTRDTHARMCGNPCPSEALHRTWICATFLL